MDSDLVKPIKPKKPSDLRSTKKIEFIGSFEMKLDEIYASCDKRYRILSIEEFVDEIHKMKLELHG